VKRGAAVAAILVLAAGRARPAADRPRYDIPYSTEVATPHVPWATKLPGGPIKGFFIPSVAEGRDMVELLQRVALEATTVTIDRQWDVNCWGIGDYYGHEYRGDRDDFETVYRYVEEELTSDKWFDVLLVPGLNGWSRLTRPSRDAILRRVRDGAGLVLLHPFVGDVKGHPFKGDEPEGDSRIWDVSPLVGLPDDFVSERGYPEINAAATVRARWVATGRHYITDGVPLALVSGGAVGGKVYAYEKAKGDVLIEAGGHPVLAVGTHGKGRVAAFAYVEEGFLPAPPDPVESPIDWSYWEYEHALLARTLLWAAGREPAVRLEASRVALGAGGEPASLELALTTAEPREVEIEVSAHGVLGGQGGVLKETRALARGRSAMSLSADRWRAKAGFSGGRQIVDVIVREAPGGATLDFGAATFEVDKPATVTAVKPNAAAYRAGDTMSIVTRAAGQLEGLKLRLEVRDDLGRLLHAEEKPTPGERYFFYRLDDFLGKRATLSASLVDAGGRVVDRKEAAPVVVTPRERRQKEYRASLSFESSRHGQGRIRLRRLRAQGMDDGFTWGGAVNDGLDIPRGYFGVYWYDRGPTTPEGLEKAIAAFERTGDFSGLQYLTKKELYRRTHDTRYLVRGPSLDDPQTLRVLADVSRAAARGKAVYGMDYYFVGDEGSLTSYTDEVDFDFGPHALANLRTWLKAQYGTLEALNRKWRAHYSDWSEVVPATTEEARASGVYPAWADHRTYMETSFANAYKVVRDAVVEADPQGHIALSGTQVTTPWNGCDWHRLDSVIDDFLSYDGGNQWDLHRSFAKPGARIGFWTGYGRRGVGVQHEIWSAALSGVLFPNLFWSYSVVNPDLTFSRSGRDMGAVFQALRFEGVGKLLMESERLDDGIAVHYSMPSVHAAGILGLHPRGRSEDDDAPGFPADRDGWVKSFGDLGLSTTFLSAEQIEAGRLDPGRFKVFVMPFSLALSEKEAAAIESFARAGGIVIADAAPGLFDEHVDWRDEGRLDRLFGIEAPAPRKRSLQDARSPGAVRVTAEGKAWGLDEAALQPLTAFEKDIRSTDGRPLLEADGTAAVVARRAGRGSALYLNTLLAGYPLLRKDGYGGGALRALLGGLLGRHGVKAPVTLRSPKGEGVGPARVSRYRFGATEVVAVLLEPTAVEKAYGRDGVTVYDDSKVGPVVRHDVEVRLPRAAHLVNARTGAFLGRGDLTRTTLAEGDALVVALNPAAPGAIGIDGPESAGRGEHPRLVVTSREGGRRLVRAHVFGPDGVFRPEFARNLLLDGSPATFVVPLALDDAVGTYRVVVEDVLSGARAETALAVN
jgi:hypothetical protein